MRAVNKRTGIKVGERLCFCWFKTKLLRFFVFFRFFFFLLSSCKFWGNGVLAHAQHRKWRHFAKEGEKIKDDDWILELVSARGVKD